MWLSIAGQWLSHSWISVAGVQNVQHRDCLETNHHRFLKQSHQQLHQAASHSSHSSLDPSSATSDIISTAYNAEI